jgi:hypothetical protein
MPAPEFNVKYVAPVPEYFSMTCNRSAAFDLIVTLRWALAEGDNVPESIGETLAALEQQFGDHDWPSGVPSLEVPDTLDDLDDTGAAA